MNEERAKRFGVKLENPEDGIYLWIQSGFSDGKIADKVTTFELSDFELVTNLLKKYAQMKGEEDHLYSWYDGGYELFNEYVPKSECGIAIVIKKFEVYAVIDGICKKITV